MPTDKFVGKEEEKEGGGGRKIEKCVKIFF